MLLVNFSKDGILDVLALKGAVEYNQIFYGRSYMYNIGKGLNQILDGSTSRADDWVTARTASEQYQRLPLSISKIHGNTKWVVVISPYDTHDDITYKRVQAFQCTRPELLETWITVYCSRLPPCSS